MIIHIRESALRAARLRTLLKPAATAFGFAIATFLVSAADPPLKVSPSTFVAGKTYTISIQASPCDGHDLSTATVLASGAGIGKPTPIPNGGHKCDWTGTLTVGQDAETGPLKLIVQEATSSTFLDVSVSAKASGPIPPGLPPTVDVAWQVLPRRISGDNFGARITKLYFPIEIVIGNNSGYDLQIASVQFTLPKGKLNTNIPSDSYYTVRSSLVKEQLIGARNSTLNIIKAAGPILTGSAVFFNGASLAALHHKNVFEGITGIFSNPLEKGLEMMIPDQTVQQLINLDNHTLRDGLIIPNNTQIRSIVFVNRDLLQRSSAILGNSEKGPTAKQLGSVGVKHDYDQIAIMKQLGELELVGKSIVYINRISLTSNPSGPGPAFTISPASVTQDDANIDAVALTLTGDGLSGGTLASSDSALAISNQKVGDGGKSFTATLDASKATPKKYTLTLTTATASQSAQFEVKPHGIVINAPATVITVKAGDSTKPVLNGKYLKNATGVPTTDCGAIALLEPTSDDTKITVDITVPGSVSATVTSCNVTVGDSSGGTATFKFTITH